MVAKVRGVPLGMRRIRPEYLDSDPSDHAAGADALVREEPEEDEEEDERDKEDEDNEEDDDEGYSE